MNLSDANLINRRTMLRRFGGALPPLICAGRLTSLDAAASSADYLGFLYDGTRCIGCRACVGACQQTNTEPPYPTEPAVDLSARSRTAIRLFREKPTKAGNTERFHFVKVQCMHCLHPACVSACPVSAMHKDPKTGTVYNDPSVCIGCRYCMVACPFDIIRFEWDKTLPRIVKCDLCRNTNMKNKGVPACVDACPVGALTFDRRDRLLTEARRRIRRRPGKYINRIYGEDDGGGTGILYLAATPFVNLGFPTRLGKRSPALMTESIQAMYKWLLVPLAGFGLLLFSVYHTYTQRVREGMRREKHEE